MRATEPSLVVAALAVGLAFAACGGSSGESARRATGAERQGSVASTTSKAKSTGAQDSSGPSEHLPTVAIEASIPVRGSGGRIPSRYTCDGRNLSLPMRWRAIPAGTAEIAIFIVNLKPVRGKLFFDWAIAGIDPAPGKIVAGAVPAGAIVGRNSSGTVGYSICPSTGTRENYIVQVLALPRRLSARPGIDARVLYREARQLARTIGFTGAEYMRLAPAP